MVKDVQYLGLAVCRIRAEGLKLSLRISLGGLGYQVRLKGIGLGLRRFLAQELCSPIEE